MSEPCWTEYSVRARDLETSTIGLRVYDALLLGERRDISFLSKWKTWAMDAGRGESHIVFKFSVRSGAVSGGSAITSFQSRLQRGGLFGFYCSTVKYHRSGAWIESLHLGLLGDKASQGSASVRLVNKTFTLCVLPGAIVQFLVAVVLHRLFPSWPRGCLDGSFLISIRLLTNVLWPLSLFSYSSILI